MVLCDLFNLNTSDSEIMINEQSDWSVVYICLNGSIWILRASAEPVGWYL